MPDRPTLHRPYKARERKDWDKGFSSAKRLTGRALQKRNARIKLRDRFTCQNKRCQVVTTELEIDHRLAVEAGGSDDDGNCRCLCASCHSVKSKIESKGHRLPDPDDFPLVYADARRLVYSPAFDPSLVDDVHDDEFN